MPPSPTHQFDDGRLKYHDSSRRRAFPTRFVAKKLLGSGQDHDDIKHLQEDES